ncbi:hypothetical protein [Bradyrhizobium ottawaense]|uniref:Uncharacterized protein n=1 Tax=Bradyrhizobium ottawaense TaxID=931866 RepID=A0ABY0QHA2_9BRAD|nr:hypothetical protein [Bradyrhizobium ottawaense]SDK42978.1 hypothetical protein SAMN05444163_8091 [Bradyrhizobium ottawaense]
MVTIREARQRLLVSGMRLSRRDAEFRVAFAELPYPKAEKSAYYTDDIEDAMLTGAMMRRKCVRPLA